MGFFLSYQATPTFGQLLLSPAPIVDAIYAAHQMLEVQRVRASVAGAN